MDIGRAYPAGGIVPGAHTPRQPDLPGEYRIPCPANPAPSAESACSSGQQLLGPGLADFQIQLLSNLMALTVELRELTVALHQTTRTNQALIEAMAEAEDMEEDGGPGQYLNGRQSLAGDG